jgi:pimeloyl-ACP methyl ester carboxylesterase
MLNPPLLDGLEGSLVETGRLKTHIITRGPQDGVPVLLIHGNVSAARFWEELMLALPETYHVVAPDLRGYGRSERAPLDATRGVRDFSDDLFALVEALGLDRPHVVGWSLGGNIAVQYAIDHPDALRSLTLVAGGSPFGFGGTHGLDGQPNSPDFAGSGGGTANPQFVAALAAGDSGDSSPVSPRNVMNSFYFRPPFRSPREDVFVAEMLTTHCAPANYPGDSAPAEHWPGVGPGTGGVNNALSPKYLNQRALADLPSRPPVLWIRGDSDQIVGDSSLFDLCMLGQIGAVPGWPGAESHPPQPMVSQLRAVLDEYAANGGEYREIVLAECGHSPQIEQPEAFNAALFAFLDQA